MIAPEALKNGCVRDVQLITATGGHRALYCREHSDSVVECLTRDPGAVGSSLTGITVLCP